MAMALPLALLSGAAVPVVWARLTPSPATSSLDFAVHRVGTGSGPTYLDSTPHGYWLNQALGGRQARQPARIASPKPVRRPETTTATGVGKPLGSFVVTCYDLGGRTASGAPVGPETVAVDPAVIPLGTHIYVEGAGRRVAEDTGGAIKGRRLDIWASSYSQCANWGVQSRPVWIQG